MEYIFHEVSIRNILSGFETAHLWNLLFYLVYLVLCPQTVF